MLLGLILDAMSFDLLTGQSIGCRNGESPERLKQKPQNLEMGMGVGQEGVSPPPPRMV